MSEKYRFFTFTNGRQYPIIKTDSGQLVVKISPKQWEALDEDQQEQIIKADNLLAAEWLGGTIYYQPGRDIPTQPGRPIWEV